MNIEQIRKALTAGINVYWQGEHARVVMDGVTLFLQSGNILTACANEDEFLNETYKAQDFYMIPPSEHSPEWEKQVAILSGYTLENTVGDMMCFCFHDDNGSDRNIIFGWGNGSLGFACMRDEQEMVFYHDSTPQPNPTPKDEADYMLRVLEFFPSFIQ